MSKYYYFKKGTSLKKIPSNYIFFQDLGDYILYEEREIDPNKLPLLPPDIKKRVNGQIYIINNGDIRIWNEKIKKLYCIHYKHKQNCIECKKLCRHSLNKLECIRCNFCTHNKQKYYCDICNMYFKMKTRELIKLRDSIFYDLNWNDL